MQSVIVGALEWYWHKLSGKWESSSIGVIFVFAWINAFLAYRWNALRREQLSGSFSAEEYRADPAGYIFGSKKQKVIVIAVGVAIAIVYVVATMVWSNE